MPLRLPAFIGSKIMKGFTIAFLVFVVIAAIYEIKVESAVKKKRKREGKIFYKASYLIMAGVYILLLVSAVGEYFLIYRKPNLLLSIAGGGLYLLGHLLRNWSIRTMEENWSLQIEIKKGQRLVKEGPYRWMRHPGYLAVILKGLGFTLIPNSYYTLLYVLLVYIPIVLVRAWFEEKILIEHFGSSYLDYKRKVYGFLPVKGLK